MAFTRFATSEPFDTASGTRLNKLGDELQEQINVLKTKTEILCTEQNGFTISKQTSYQINNVVFYCVRFSGTLQANAVATVAKMPTGKYNTSNSVSGCFSGVNSNLADGVGMARFTSTGNIDVKCNVAISDFTVSGVIVL